MNGLGVTGVRELGLTNYRYEKDLSGTVKKSCM